MILFHFCTTYEVQNADNALTFKISSDDEVPEIYGNNFNNVSR